MKFPCSGLYAITQTEGKTSESIIHEVSCAIKGGASVIQYRDKEAVDAFFLAKELLSLCKHHKIPLIINDNVDLATRIGAHGVHLGKDDEDVSKVRNQMGPKAIIGVSCYNDIDKALIAKAKGVDYVAFGRFFPSSSKPLASAAHIEILNKAKKQINLPIVAIGGILPENGSQLLNAGADVLAVIGGIFDHDPEQSARNYLKLFIT